MSIFLEDIAQELLNSGGNDFSNHCVVLPNRRAGVFLRDAISRFSQKAIWMPTILSIEDFVFQASDMAKADQTTILFEFYEVYRKSVTDPQSIEMFANWAPTFLSDINELDLNLIDAEDIFSQLYSIERIKKWNPETGIATEFQDKHIQFVKRFYSFYTELRSALSSKNLAYGGMAFRHVASLSEKEILQSPWQTVWFAGFNALTISEEHILNSWQLAGRAQVFWDMDSHYTDDPIHEAGHYLRRYVGNNSALKIQSDYRWKSGRLSSEKKEINLIAVQRNMAQAVVAGSILKEKLQNQSDKTLANTAVVLNDEQMLIPLLSSIPTNLNGVNITMGYGLQQSQSAVFIEKLFNLYSAKVSSADKFERAAADAIFSDSFFNRLNVGGGNIQTHKKAFYSLQELNATAIQKLIFNNEMSSVSGFLQGVKAIIDTAGLKLSQLEDNSLEREFLLLLEGLVQRLIDLNKEYGGIDAIKTLHTFWKQLLRTQQLDFVGEPLHGLQVMGMLETRNLDFETVIMLGVNEGNLPSSAHSNSYFTFDIRRAYGLACQNERDSVTAYHFYRLLQRAKQVYLVYDQSTDSLGGGEVSRYVKQLMMDDLPNIDINEWKIDQEIPASGLAPEIIIPKGEKEFDVLRERAAKGISPSALNTFRSCSLKYYFRYVAGIKEPNKYGEDMDSAQLGTAIHDTLEQLYIPFIGKQLNEEIIKSLLPEIDAVLTNKFQEQLEETEPLTGKNLLTFEVAKSYVVRALKHDLKTIRSGEVITLLSLEEELKGEVVVEAGGEQIKVKLTGKADRIDRKSDGSVRLIDYKTGVFTGKKTGIKSLADFDKTTADIAFQLLMYLAMYSENPNSEKLVPTAFFLRAQKVEIPVTVQEEKVDLQGQELVDYAVELITSALFELYDKDAPFSQTSDTKTCEYCEFNQVCQRN